MNIEITGAERRHTLSIRCFMDEATSNSRTRKSGFLDQDELRRLVADMID